MGHPNGDAQGIRIWAKAVKSGGWNLDLQTPRLPLTVSLASSYTGLRVQDEASLSCGLNRRWLLTTSSSEK